MKGGQSFKQKVDGLAKRFVENYRRGDTKTCAEVYTEDGMKILQGGVMLKGRKAIAADLQQSFDSHYEITRLTTTCSEADGKIVYATLILHSPSGEAHVMLALRCDSQGIWRICAEAIVDSA